MFPKVDRQELEYQPDDQTRQEKPCLPNEVALYVIAQLDLLIAAARSVDLNDVVETLMAAKNEAEAQSRAIRAS